MIGWIIYAYWSQKTSQCGKNIRNTPHHTTPHHTTPHHTTPPLVCLLFCSGHNLVSFVIYYWTEILQQGTLYSDLWIRFHWTENKKFLTQLFLWWLQVSVQQPLLICLSWHFATCLNILRCNFLPVQGFQLVVVFPGLGKERLRLTKYFNSLWQRNLVCTKVSAA